MTVTPAALASGGLYMSLTGANNVATWPQGSSAFLLPNGSFTLEFTAVAGVAYRIDCYIPQSNPLRWRASIDGQTLGGPTPITVISGHAIFLTPKAPAAGQVHVQVDQPNGSGAYTQLTSCTVGGFV